MSKWIVSFGWNHEGLGHISRLLEIHSEIIENYSYRGLFFVQHEQELINDYTNNSQIIIPSYNGALLGDDWWTGKTLGVPKKTAEKVTKGIINESLENKQGIIIFDVVIHKDLYEYGTKNKWPMYLVIRKRNNMQNLIDYINNSRLKIEKIFILDDDSNYISDIEIKKINSIVRRRGTDSIWDDENGNNILISAGGGGHKDASLFIHNALEAIKEYCDNSDKEYNIFVNPGPFYKEKINIRKMPKNCNLIIKNYIPANYSQYKNTNLLICQSGYNTINEIKNYSGRVLIVPGNRSADDQKERAIKVQRSNIRISENNPKSILATLYEFKVNCEQKISHIERKSGSKEIFEEIDKYLRSNNDEKRI